MLERTEGFCPIRLHGFRFLFLPCAVKCDREIKGIVNFSPNEQTPRAIDISSNCREVQISKCDELKSSGSSTLRDKRTAQGLCHA